MAVFNPQVQPTQDPNYFKYSEPIKGVKADESTGIALQTLGKGIEGSAELADSVVKGIIKTDVYSRTDPLQEKYISALTDIRNDPTGTANNQPSSVGPDGTAPAALNLMAGNNDPSMPQGLANSINTIQRLGAASASGKPSETLINQRLYAELKDVRSTYPGWRDYIDQQMQKATGKDIANDLVSSLRDDIAKQGKSAADETKFWEHQIVSNAGFGGSAEVLQEYKQTGNSNKVMQWLSYNQGQINVLNLKKAAFESAGQDRTTQIQNAEDYANTAAMHASTNHFYNSQKFTNGDMSPSDIADKMIDLSLHPEKANDVAYQGLAERYKALETQSYSQTMRLLSTPGKDKDGRLTPSVADVLGADKTKSIVDKSVGALFAKTNEFISDKQFSPAYSLQNAAAATVNNATFKVFQDPTVGGRLITASVLNKIAPNLTPVIIGKLLGSGLDTDLGNFVTEQGKQAIAQTGGKYYGVDGKIYSFKQSLEELDQASNISGKATPGQAFNNLLEVRKAITDKSTSPEAQGNAIKYFYDGVNKGTMDKFMDDYYDPSKSTVTKGRTSAFSTLTAEDVTKSIWERSKNGSPTDWQKYSTWAKTEASGMIRNQVQDINKIDELSNDIKIGPTGRGLPGSQVKTAWDTETHQFKILNYDGSPASYLQREPQAVTNLNTVLRSMANIAKTEGSNVDAYLFKVLKDAGYSPTHEVDGVPAQIMKSLITANGGKVKTGAQAPEAPKVPVSRFAPEDVGGDLQSFLTSPAGSPRPTGASQRKGVIKGNLSDETLTNIQTDDIPEGMSAREFINQLKSGKKLGGSVQ